MDFRDVEGWSKERSLVALLVGALLAAAVLPMVGGVHPSNVAASLSVLVAAGAMALLARRWLAKAGDGPAQDDDRAPAPSNVAETLESELTSYWVRHLETGRTQSEQAVVDLTQRFSGIVDRLERAVDAATRSAAAIDSEQGLQSAFADSQRQLQSILGSLRQAIERSDLLLRSLGHLVGEVGQLQEMSGLVTEMANQIKLVALNAAVEAAHAGAAGRGFAVVADEVRRLSGTSGETSQQISRKVDSIREAIHRAFQTAEESAEQAALASAETVIVDVMNHFRTVTGGLKGAADILQETSIGIRAEVAESLVLLQFQDRVSQILSHVRDNIQAFPGYLAERAVTSALDAIDWSGLREALERSYATIEEHGGPAAGRAAAEDDEITFF